MRGHHPVRSVEALLWCLVASTVAAGCAGGASREPAPLLWPTGADAAAPVPDGPAQTTDADHRRRPDFATAGPPEWRVVASPTDVTLRALWGSSSADVWAVGDSNTIVHFDGSQWEVVEEGGSAVLRTVWCDAPGEAWAGGDQGLLHYDGQSWLTTDGPLASTAVLGLWAADASHVWAVGYDGAWRFDGQAWQAASPEPPSPLSSVWGLANEDVWAVSGSFYHHDGQRWSMSDNGFGVLLGGIWGAGADDVWAVGHGNTLAHYDGTSWELLTGVDMDRPHYYHIWGSAPDEVWIVGEGGIIEHYDGDAWGTWPGPTDESLLGIWGSAPDDVWAVGVSGTILRYH